MPADTQHRLEKEFSDFDLDFDLIVKDTTSTLRKKGSRRARLHNLREKRIGKGMASAVPSEAARTRALVSEGRIGRTLIQFSIAK
jgi:hypothetical protein